MVLVKIDNQSVVSAAVPSLEGKSPPGLFLWRIAYEEQKETAGKPQTL